jgi:hypothetical protein
MAAGGSLGPRNIKTYLRMMEEKRFLAPNLKECHFWLFKGGHKSNTTLECVLGLR